MKTRIGLTAVIAASAMVAGANAEFVPGQDVGFSGIFTGGLGSEPPSNWGGVHTLGGLTVFDGDSNYPMSGYDIIVTSTVNDPWSVTFVMDFRPFAPSYYPGFAAFDILGLKQDGSIIGVAGPMPGFSTDGNNVHWEGTGAFLDSIGGVLTFKVYQEPAPGALALLAMAGAFGTRRRRG